MKITVFHTDEYFVNVFTAFLTRKRPDIELFCFTSEDAARQALAAGRTDLVLSEEGFLEDCAAGRSYIRLGMTTYMPKENGAGSLNIYQRASVLLEDFNRIVSVCAGGKQEKTSGGRLLAVYSTEGGSGKTTVSYLTAVQAAKRTKTAYWNLELLPVTDNLYQLEFPHTMEELMFERQNGSDIRSLLYDTLRVNADGVYVMPSVQTCGNYRDMDSQLVNEFCSLMYQLGIEQVIIDLPSGLSRFSDELLLGCSRIVWVFSDTPCGRKKEERVKQDPSLTRLLPKSCFVRNSCASQSSAAGVTAAFPRSSTLSTAGLISTVLEVNPDFVNGCLAILQEE